MSRSTRVTASLAEKNQRQEISLESRRRDLKAYADENAKLLAVADRQARIDVLRRQTQLQMCKNEQEHIDNLENQRSNRLRTEKINRQNEERVSQLNRDAVQEQRRGLQMQRICEESQELRDLENALKIAYLNKERDEQYEEKILRSAQEQERMEEIEDRMEFDRQRAIQFDAQRAGMQKGKIVEQRSILQQQMKEKEQAVINARKQIEIEKFVVDNIVEKINQEDLDELRRRKDLQAVTAQMVRDSEERRYQELAAAKRAAQDEEDRIIAYNKFMMARSEGEVAKRQARKDEEDRVLQRNLRDVAHKRREEEDFTELRDMLWEEELEEKRAAAQREKVDRQAEMRREMMQANSHMLASKAEIRQMEMERESRIVSNMRQKFAEDDLRDRELEEARRLSKIQHMSLIERQRADKQCLHSEERAREREAADNAARDEEYKRRVVQEARKRLLEEHSAKLQGYLPGKVFKNTEEYAGYQQQQQQRRPDSTGFSR
jgi:Trichohyalin-plectin-homology domain